MGINKTLAGLGAAVVIGAAGLALSASPAFASSFGCAPQVGCATLHSTQPDNAGTAIAVDAKKQSSAAGTQVIGYPDLVQDKATSFDKVAHFLPGGPLHGKTVYTFVYAPTGNWTNMCLTADPVTHLVTLQACTLGHNAYQLFAAGLVEMGNKIQFPVQIPNFAGNHQYVLTNLGGVNLNSITTVEQALMNVHLLADTNTASPLIPVAQGAPDTRQLTVHGSLYVPVPNALSARVNGSGYEVDGVTAPTGTAWNWHT